MWLANCLGGTTNSDSGVSDLKAFYDTFAAMEEHGISMSLMCPLC